MRRAVLMVIWSVLCAGCSPRSRSELDNAGTSSAPADSTRDVSDDGAVMAPGSGTVALCPPLLHEPPKRDSVPDERYTMPAASVGRAPSDSAANPVEDISLDQAVKIAGEAEALRKTAASGTAYDAWFFDGFDRSSLLFHVARFEPFRTPQPECPPRRLCHARPNGTYKSLHRYRVARTHEAEVALHVSNDVNDYENGVCGIRMGMTTAQVHDLLGQGQRTLAAQRAFTTIEEYPGLMVHYDNDKVTGFSR